MSYEAHEKANGDILKQRNLFWKMLLEELERMKGEDIAPHLSCTFDVIKREYIVEIKLPVGFHKMNSTKCNVE